ncbi:MAG: hypothetical protein ACK481_01290 [Candidatus Melainabacteria bacterium]|jgi:hypothetical protein
MNRDGIFSWIFVFITITASYFFTKWSINGGYQRTDPLTFWVLAGLIGFFVTLSVVSLIYWLISFFKGSVKIIFDKPNHNYNLGEIVSGKINLIARTTLESENGIKLSIHATRTPPKQANGSFPPTIVYYTHTINLPLPNYGMVNLGEYEIPFEMVLPNKETIRNAVNKDTPEIFQEILNNSIVKDIMQVAKPFGRLDWNVEARVNLPGVDLSQRELISVNTGVFYL